MPEIAPTSPSLLPRPLLEPTWRSLPVWRGANLINMFAPGYSTGRFEELDFQLLRVFGLNFVRLPISYRCYTVDQDPARFDEAKCTYVDEAVAWGERYGLHVNLNLHTLPGYRVNAQFEVPFLGEDEKMLAAACAHWAMWARRYRHVPNRLLSFNPLNEPDTRFDRALYRRVIEALVAAIRREHPERLIIVDGLNYGRDPLPELADLEVAQSCRGYDPMPLSHWLAPWAPEAKSDTPPSWPGLGGGNGPAWIRRLYQPWRDLQEMGVGVHVGEWGCYSQTEHRVALAWMRDLCDYFEAAHWGWALWNWRGPFGVFDSGRLDVSYEDFGGLALDRQMLTVLSPVWAWTNDVPLLPLRATSLRPALHQVLSEEPRRLVIYFLTPADQTDAGWRLQHSKGSGWVEDPTPPGPPRRLGDFHLHSYEVSDRFEGRPIHYRLALPS